MRSEVLDRDAHECQNCGGGERLEVHHIRRERAGGADRPENLITLCELCHSTAHALDDGDIISAEVLDGVPDPSNIRGLEHPLAQVVLDKIKEGRGGQPWGRANPRWLIDQTDLDKGNVEFCLRSLRDAGWVERIARGLYELREDPREGDGRDRHQSGGDR
jgi:hypothetical protein